jgi:hypothetical protein
MKTVDQIVKDEIRYMVQDITKDNIRGMDIHRKLVMPTRTHMAFIHIRLAISRELKEYLRN